MRGVGDHIEVWVANDLSFPAGDCRPRSPARRRSPTRRSQHLVTEFDGNMYPKETATFSTPPDRDGTNASRSRRQRQRRRLHRRRRQDRRAGRQRPGRQLLHLPGGADYIAGFFSSQFNELLDRNVMTVDAFDWAHRTTDNPPDEPTADLCTSRPAPAEPLRGHVRPRVAAPAALLPGPVRDPWVNEGLSDFAQTLTGYVDASATVRPGGGQPPLLLPGFGIVQTAFNPNPRDCGGPENSLNLWGEDRNANAVLADYGNAYSFMLFLFDRYGTT